MANNENVTIKFQADISDLKSGITDANKDIKLANAEFKAASSGMDDWGTSSEGISEKLKQLEKVLTAENKKLSSYQEQLKRVNDAETKNKKSAEELRKKYEQTVQQYGKNSTEAKKLEKQLSAVTKEQTKNAKEAEKLTLTILNQQTTVNNVTKEFEKFEEKLEEVQKAEKETANGFTVLKGAMSNLVASGLKSLISGFLKLGESTKEFRKEMGKVETAFTTSGHTAEIAQKTYDDFYAILGDSGQTTEAVSHLAKLAKTEEELTKWTKIATGVYGAFGNSIPIESLTEAANETAKTGELTGALSDALSWSGVNVELYGKSLKSAKTEEERMQIITKTLNNEFGEASKKYKEVNKDVMEANRAQNEMNKTMAKLGESTAPITTAMKKGFATILLEIVKLVETSNVEEWAKKISESFSGFVDVILPKIVDLFEWIIENKDGIIAGIVGIGAAFAVMNVANMIMGLVNAFKAFKKAQEGATVAQWLLNAAMNANIFGIIAAAIAGLVAAFIYLWKTNEDFRNFWIGFVKKIKDVFLNGVEAIANFATKTIPKLIDNISKWFSELPGKISKWLSDTLNKIQKWGSDLAQKGKSAAKELLDSVVNGIKELPNKIKSIGSDMVKGLWNGINDMVGWIKGKISGFSESVLNGIKNFFGVKSPSTVMEKVIGNNLVAGLVVGIDKKAKNAVKAMENLSQDLMTPMKGVVSGVNGNLKVSNSNSSHMNLNPVNSAPVYNYTQINNSPKALSRLEIYRQTKNALEFATI